MKSINNAMRKAHDRLATAGNFTAEQGHLLIRDTTGADLETSGWIFAIMRAMGYIVESPLGGFRAAGGGAWN